MRTLQAFRRKLDPKDWRYRRVGEDCSVLLNEPARVVDAETGELILVYGQLFPEAREALRGAVTTIDYLSTARTLGIKQHSRTFGYMPRNAIRHDVCRPTAMSHEFPQQNEIVCGLGRQLQADYALHAPVAYRHHAQTISEKVLPDWRMPGSIFTSGIINKDCAMNYHTDTGNFPGCWSLMAVLRSQAEGGWLSLPEFNLNVACADGSFVLFNGQDYIHGVTPIKKLDEKDGYRISVVYYSLQQLWKCLPVEQEKREFLKRRTERERKRANKPVAKAD